MGLKVKNSDEFLTYVRKAGYNQGMFAKRLDITPQYLSAITHGRRSPSFELAILIGEELNVDLKDIFYFLDERVSKRLTLKNISVAKS